MSSSPHTWTLDPNDPVAPPLDVWNAMSDAERAAVVDSLPAGWPDFDSMAPEGEFHSDVVAEVKDVLRGWYGRGGRSVYVATEMMVYYPGERACAPDILAVLDVSTHKRDTWVVAAEGRGLDVVIEVYWKGRAAKDLRGNVQRYARLGIPEYFVFDRRRMTVRGWRLAAPGDRIYEPIVPHSARWLSRLLGLEIGFEGDRFRFYAAGAVLPDSIELLERANRVASELQSRVEAEEQRAAAEAQRAAAEAQRAADALARVAELERLLEEARKKP